MPPSTSRVSAQQLIDTHALEAGDIHARGNFSVAPIELTARCYSRSKLGRTLVFPTANFNCMDDDAVAGIFAVRVSGSD